jgi:hypothetical protein
MQKTEYLVIRKEQHSKFSLALSAKLSLYVLYKKWQEYFFLTQTFPLLSLAMKLSITHLLAPWGQVSVQQL